MEIFSMNYKPFEKIAFITLFGSLILLLLTNLSFGEGEHERDTTFKNSLGMEFVLVHPGKFMMGSIVDDGEAKQDESPRHLVEISKGFYLGKFEVTQEEYRALTGTNPSKVEGTNHPVESVSFEEVHAFIDALNAKEGHSRYRLPTEAEWEYAARAGTFSIYYFGNDPDLLGNYAWYGGNSGEDFIHHSVGKKLPNPWGLFDMHGNVWEWIEDWYGETYYSKSPAVDPPGEKSGEYRVIRSGSSLDFPKLCRSSARLLFIPNNSIEYIGFRLALSLE
jgi:formylglycine-generating enzyme required for sulfatase activity